MKKIILNLLCVIVSYTSNAQNPLWTLTPNLVSGSVLSLPIGPPSSNPLDPYDYYQGWAARQGSNAMQDVNGNLRFFIVDGVIYDETGKYAAYAWAPYAPPTYTQDPITNAMLPEGDGGSEIVIIPHPSKCNLYYIFGIQTKWSGDITKSLPGFTSTLPMYCLYDALNKQVLIRGSWYAPYPTDMLDAPQSNPIFTDVSTQNPIYTNGDSQVTPNIWMEDYSFGTASLAAAPIGTQGEYFIVCKMRRNFYIVRMDINGNLKYWKRFLHTNTMGGYTSRCEAELVFDETENAYKLAFGNLPTQSSSNLGSYSVEYYKLNNNLLNVLEHQTYEIPNVAQAPNASFHRPVHGIEFSSNKKYLYFNSSSDPLNTVSNLHVADLTTGTGAYNSLTLTSSQSNAIKNGNIELAQGNRLLISSPNGLYEIYNQNTSTPSLSLSPVVAFNYQNNLGVNTQGSIYMSNDYLVAYTLPDQIDGLNYTAHFTQIPECCIANTTYDKITYTATTTSTWLPGFGSNPIDATPLNSTEVTISKELRIKAGTTVTIKNMVLKFAPDAKLIIEEGTTTQNGGRLILDNTKLTIDNSCSTTSLWTGVRVYGNTLLPQGTPMVSSKQGVLIMKNNSIIEHAKEGVMLGEFYQFFGINLYKKHGGIIQARDSYFLNNTIDVLFPMKQTQNAAAHSNLSSFINTSFIWDNANITGVSPTYHVIIRDVKGVSFKGCDFENTWSPYKQTGVGISCFNSTFNVEALCLSGNSPCTNLDYGKFENLKYGIQAQNSISTHSFIAKDLTFKNNLVGIIANGVNLSKVTNNNFIIFEHPSSSIQTAGMVYTSCPKFVIEENKFQIENSVQAPYAATYGIQIKNSGNNINRIYMNSFTNLKIGGQCEGLNSVTNLPFAKSGLTWKCNVFNQIAKHDIAVVNGTIAKRQGTYINYNNANEAIFYSANNVFSLSNEGMLMEHDLKVVPNYLTEPITYYHAIGPLSNPDSYTNPWIVPVPSYLPNGMPVFFDYSKGCRTTSTGNGNNSSSISLNLAKAKLDSMQLILDEGNASNLYQLIQNGNPGTTKSALLTASPYLSDSVLKLYISSTPPNGHLLQVLIANSTLSQNVLSALNASSAPFGIKALINSIQQITPKKREALENMVSYAEEDYFRIFDEMLRENIFNYSDTNSLNNLISLLSTRNEKIYQEMLVNAKIEMNNLSEATQHNNSLDDYGRSKEINQIEIAVSQSNDTLNFINSNQLDTLINISNDQVNCVCSGRATSFLNSLYGNDLTYHFADIPTYSSRGGNNGSQTDVIEIQSEDLMVSSEIFEVYPNPFSTNLSIKNSSEINSMIYIYDVDGRIVYQNEINGKIQEIKTENWKKGLYIIKILDETNNQILVDKILKL